MEQVKSKETNTPLDWDELHLDIWELFNDPKNITNDEIRLARVFLNLLNVDPEDQCIITFRATPNDLANLFVNYLRSIKTQFPEKFPEKFPLDH